MPIPQIISGDRINAWKKHSSSLSLSHELSFEVVKIHDEETLSYYCFNSIS